LLRNTGEIPMMTRGESQLGRGKVQPPRFAWPRRGLLGVSLVSLAMLTLCYWAKFDACAVVTLVPGWWWALPGIALVGWACWRSARRIGLLAGGLWIAFAVLAAEIIGCVFRSRTWLGSHADERLADLAIRSGLA